MTDAWSARKARVRAEAEAAAREAEDRAAAAETAELDALPDDEVLARLDLPDPDTLRPGDDAVAFMARAVPERIRRRALRALWRTNPVLANVDGLVDYGQDFTDAAMVPDVIATTYEVGKGLAAHVRKMAEAAAAEEAEAPQGEAPAEPAPEAAPALAAAPEPAPEPHDTEEPAPRPRARMRFEFEETA